MSAEFIPADETGAEIIADLRREIWLTTYRGIYSDERIDNYDREGHLLRDLERIRDSAYHVYLITDITDKYPIGFFTFRAAETVYIRSLYIRTEYQHRGIGKQAFGLIREYCRANGYDRFTCNCNFHNYPAQGFYRAMGGEVIGQSAGHEDKYYDQITFEFCV